MRNDVKYKDTNRDTIIVLASASPRREKILKLFKLDFEVVKPIGVEEEYLKSPCNTVIHNSIRKVKDVYQIVKQGKPEFLCHDRGKTSRLLIAGFDTVVYLKGRYFGKPSDNEQAFEYLKALSGKTHLVVSGACLFDSDREEYSCAADITKVKFRKLTSEEIENYLRNEYVLDKAGAYDISSYGALLVERIEGCFFNVAGIPVSKLVKLFTKFGYKII